MTSPTDVFVERLVAKPNDSVICSDFDGTLAPLVADPELARPEPAALVALAELARRVRTVAVISGRPIDFLRSQLGDDVLARVELYGRYGAEHQAPGGEIEMRAAGPDIRAAFGRLSELALAAAPGVRVEDKGGSMALHWREIPELEGRLVALATDFAARESLDARPGKMMIDLVAPDAPDKGSTLETVLGGAAVGCFLGDDVGDLEAFAALDRFEERGGTALRVAVTGAEAPAGLAERADVVLATPRDAAAFLSGLAAALE